MNKHVKTTTIQNKLGLHARAAAKMVNTASRFGSTTLLYKGDNHANAKSIMGVMMLAASCGTPLEITSEGEDAKEAIDAVIDLIEDKFGEHE